MFGAIIREGGNTRREDRDPIRNAHKNGVDRCDEHKRKLPGDHFSASVAEPIVIDGKVLLDKGHQSAATHFRL